MNGQEADWRFVAWFSLRGRDGRKGTMSVDPGNSTMSEPPQQTTGEAGPFPVCNPPAAFQLKPQTSSSPCGSPRMSPCGSPRSSPRHSPLLFRKLLMNRSLALQRRFTLAHTPRYHRWTDAFSSWQRPLEYKCLFLKETFAIKVTRPSTCGCRPCAFNLNPL